MLGPLLISVLLSVAAAQFDGTMFPDLTGNEIVEATISKIEASCAFPSNKLYLRRVAVTESGDGTLLEPDYSGGIWRVDADMLAATQSNSELDVYTAAIEAEFGIVWNDLGPEDMRVPMYSGLGALLFTLLNDPNDEFPVSVEDQATYYVDNYRAGASPADYIAAASLLIHICANLPIDLLFLVDESSSIGSLNYPSIKTFMQNIVNSFDIGPEATRVGIMKFAQMFSNPETTIELYLNELQTAEAINNHIEFMRFNGGNTPTHRGLEEAREVMFAPGNGARPDILNIRRVIVLFTDGNSDNPEATLEQADINHRAGFATIVVGVDGHEDIDFTELHAIASEPTCHTVIELREYNDLNNVNDFIVERICEAPCVLPSECSDVFVQAGIDQFCFIRLGRNGSNVVMTPESENVAFLVDSDTWPSMVNFEDEMRVAAGETGTEYIELREGAEVLSRFKFTAMIAEGDTIVNICAEPFPEDPCNSNPCQNDGQCVWWGTGVDDYICRCKYWDGDFCETAYEEILPFQKEGHWVQVKSYECADGYTGDQCDISIA